MKALTLNCVQRINNPRKLFTWVSSLQVTACRKTCRTFGCIPVSCALCVYVYLVPSVWGCTCLGLRESSCLVVKSGALTSTKALRGVEDWWQEVTLGMSRP